MVRLFNISYSFAQYLHPYKTQSYRMAVQAIRKIGRECIQWRISAIENGEQVPNDILTQIIKVTSEPLQNSYCKSVIVKHKQVRFASIAVLLLDNMQNPSMAGNHSNESEAGMTIILL